MVIRYTHTNIIAKDWRKLAQFYQEVLDCVFVPPERKLSGKWLEKGTGVQNPTIEGVHLWLPGFEDGGPTLEIFTYSSVAEKPAPAANRLGLGHLAFQVDDVQRILEQVIERGGGKLGEIVVKEIKDVGKITFVYATDPEGNILEIQNWA